MLVNGWLPTKLDSATKATDNFMVGLLPLIPFAHHILLLAQGHLKLNYPKR